MKKAAIPSVRTGQPELDRALAAVKQNVDAMTGQARNAARIEMLQPAATQADIIKTINLILERLQ